MARARVTQNLIEALVPFTQATAAVEGATIPVMTSNTTPSGVVTYSTQHYEAWQAFYPGNSQWGWLSNGSALPQWLGYQFPTAKTVRRYTMRAYYDEYNSYNRRIKTWKFQGSTDGNAWDDLDTQTDYVWANYTDYFLFEIASPAEYAYYRVYVTANYGDQYVGIGGLQMWDNATTTATVSQYVVEALGSFPGHAHVSQCVVEVLMAESEAQSDPPSSGGGGTHVFGYAG